MIAEHMRSLRSNPAPPPHTHTQAAAAHCCWRSLQALLAVNRYWGILKHGWAPMASFVTAAVMTAAAACCWLLMGRSRKRTMLGFQVSSHVTSYMGQHLAGVTVSA